MNDAAAMLGTFGYVVAVACFAAYVWGYILKVRAFRPLSIVALFSTIFAMAQLALVLHGQGGQINVTVALIFLIISGLAQSYNALIGRAGRAARGEREADETS